jgi:hypothetical protein
MKVSYTMLGRDQGICGFSLDQIGMWDEHTLYYGNEDLIPLVWHLSFPIAETLSATPIPHFPHHINTDSRFTPSTSIPPTRHPPLHLRIPPNPIHIRPNHNLQKIPLHHPPPLQRHRPTSPNRRRTMVSPRRSLRTEFNECRRRPGTWARGNRMVGGTMGCWRHLARGYGFEDSVVCVSEGV